MNLSHKLKSNNKPAFMVPSARVDGYQNWSNDHRRVFVAYNEQELRSAKNGQRGHIQIVKKSNLIEMDH